MDEKHFELTISNGMQISCLSCIPEEPAAIVIITHGFGSSKESPMAKLMLGRLPDSGYGAIAYDLPAHGSGSSREIELTLENCIDAMKTIEEYLISSYLFPRIYYFSSSFGAYVNLNFLLRCPHTGDKSFLRSAAVNMPELFAGEPDPEVIEILDRKGYIPLPDASGNDYVRVPKRFFEELLENDLFETVPCPAFSSPSLQGMDFLMVHGECDEVIDPDKARSFASEKSIDIVFLPGEDHTLSTAEQTPSKVAQISIEFFGD